MRRFAVFVIALVLAPGLQSAFVQVRPEVEISTWPQAIAPELRPLPLPMPEVMPEVHPETPVVPELITVNPCDACFEYMTALIEQLAGVPEVPVHPEIEVLPEIAPEVEIRPLPLPVAPVPEVELRPLPIYV